MVTKVAQLISYSDLPLEKNSRLHIRYIFVEASRKFVHICILNSTKLCTYHYLYLLARASLLVSYIQI